MHWAINWACGEEQVLGVPTKIKVSTRRFSCDSTQNLSIFPLLMYTDRATLSIQFFIFSLLSDEYKLDADEHTKFIEFMLRLFTKSISENRAISNCIAQRQSDNSLKVLLNDLVHLCGEFEIMMNTLLKKFISWWPNCYCALSYFASQYRFPFMNLVIDMRNWRNTWPKFFQIPLIHAVYLPPKTVSSTNCSRNYRESKKIWKILIAHSGKITTDFLKSISLWH